MSEPDSPASEPVPASAQALVGRTLSDRYRIDAVLGFGGMGAVYRAEHLLLNKQVAVKVLHPEMSGVSEVVARFEREAKAAAHIEHPNVAAATDFGRLEDGSFFLVLEFIEGRSLRDEIHHGPMAAERAAHIVRQILSALSRAHGLGIVHRDLKPENVMLVPRDGDPDFVKVLDFGIAKVQMESRKQGETKALTQAGLVYGTPEYMAPEQALGQEVDARADLYSTGVIFYELLTGHRPFEADDPVRLLGMVISQEVPAMDVPVPEGIERAVRAMLARLREERVPDAKTAMELLGSPSIPNIPQSMPSYSTIVGAGTHLPTAHAATRAVAPVGKPLPIVPLAAGGGVLVLILVVVVLLVSRSPQAESKGPTVTSTATSSAPAPRRELTEDDIKAAEFTGPEAVEKLLAERPGDPRIERALARAHLSAKAPERAMQVYERMLEREPTLASDKTFRDAIVAVAVFDGGTEAAFASMESRLGELGPDLLYDLAVGQRVNPKLQKRAQEAIAADAILQKASKALKVALELRAARRLGGAEMCEKRKALFVRAKDEADGRSMPYLSELTSRRGCGFLKRSDCFPCLRDGSLEAAISAVSAREKGKQ